MHLEALMELQQRRQSELLSQQSTNIQSFSWSQVILYIIAVALVACATIVSPLMLLLSLVALVPSAIVYGIYDTAVKDSTKRVDNPTLAYSVLFTCTIGFLVMAIAQALLSFGLAYLCLGKQTPAYLEEFSKTEVQVDEITDPDVTAKRARMASAWRWWIYMLIFVYLVPGFTEEMLKYVALPFASKYLLGGDHTITPDANLAIVTAAALGFAAVENIGFLYGAAFVSREPPRRLALTVFERVFFGGWIHVMTALLIGLNIVSHFPGQDRIDLHALSFGNILSILALPVFFHGTFDLILFATSAAYGNVGWVHPRSGRMMYLMYLYCLLVEVSCAIVVWKRWNGLGVSL